MNVLKRVIRKIKKMTTIYLSPVWFVVLKSKHECNICHFKANRFESDNWHLYVHCPKCYSDVKQRLLWATLTNVKQFSLKEIIEGKDVLHFAPENNMRNLIRKYAGTYKTADFFAEGYNYSDIDYKTDISKMKTIEDESYDCIIACDVLEHVIDYENGLDEVYRVLRKGGHCIFTVPQRDGLKKTYEDKSITMPNEREKAYGQFDHLRIFGDDFCTILEKHRFIANAIDSKFFSNDIVERFILFPPVISRLENATNYRKIFIGKK